MLSPTAVLAPLDDLLQDLLDVSLTGVIFYTPRYEPDNPDEVIDFAMEYLNAAAQRMMALPAVPTRTHLEQWPHSLAEGSFRFHVEAFLNPDRAVCRYEVNYQADGYDNYYRIAARRSGSGLLVSFTDTADQPRTAVEVALREAQAAEQAARADADAQRQELARLFEQAPVALAVFDGPRYVVELANPAVLQLWGRTAAQTLGTPLFELLPEISGQGFEELLDGVRATGVAHVAHEMPSTIDRAGHRATVYWNFVYQPRRGADGRVTGVAVVATDVSEQVLARQQAERHSQELEARVVERTAQLRRQERQLQQILGLVPAAVATFVGPAHCFAFFNQAYQQLAQRPPRLDEPLADVFPEAVAQGFVALLDAVYATGRPFRTTEAPLDLADPATGETMRCYLDYLYQPLPDAHGRPGGILSFAVDVTEKVLARQQNEALQADLLAAARQQAQEREAFFQAFEQTTAAVALLRGPTYRFEYVNPAYQAFYPGRQLVGLDLVVANPEVVGADFVTLLDRVYQSGETFFGNEVPMAQPPAANQPVRPAYFNFTYQAYREAGVIVGIYVVAYDVTEQVLARQEREVERLTADSLRLGQQQALFEAVQQAQETERRRIAEGLHNGVGQTLFATKLRLDQLHAPLLDAAPVLVAARREADALLADAIRQVRALSHELVPQILQEFGLAVALQHVCQQLSTPALWLRCLVLLDEQLPPLPPLLALALYRMAQELGLNIVKHARGATHASLELETIPGFALLRAEDDGPGFAQDPATASGQGLRAIRDRVALLGGTLELGHQAGQGTFVRLRIPFPPESTAVSAPSR